MLKNTVRRLTALNVLVFVLVLAVSMVCNYVLFLHSMDRDEREDLEHLMTVLESSMESSADEVGEIPDVVEADASATVRPVPEETIQWFDCNGKLLAERGALKVVLPLDVNAKFQVQKNVHALLLTHLVRRGTVNVGYFRVATPLARSDHKKKQFLKDQILATLLASLASGIAILWLIRQTLKPVALSMQQMAQFTADASHELQGPVMAIKTNGAVALKYSEGMRTSDREKIEMMVDAANQMASTLKALLRLADLEHRPRKEDFEQIMVDELVQDLIEELADAARAKSVAVRTESIDASLSFQAVETDARTALLNVLRNAIAYSNDEAEVLIRAKKTGKFVQFQIQDFGIGIEAQDLPHIFDRFWRSDVARSYRSGGQGLGLSIAKNIVDLYRGTITVESEPGIGSIFTIRFPETPST